MTQEVSHRLATVAAILWFWTVCLQLLVPPVATTLGTEFAVLALVAVLGVIVVLYLNQAELLHNARAAAIFIAAGVVAFSIGLAHYERSELVALNALGVALASVVLALLSGFSAGRNWAGLQLVTVVVAVAAIAALAAGANLN